MERKLIFLDIDGTILIPGMVVRREVMEGLGGATGGIRSLSVQGELCRCCPRNWTI